MGPIWIYNDYCSHYIFHSLPILTGLTFYESIKVDPPRKCYRCNDGVYDEFWVLLELYEFGGYEFHRPVKRTRIMNEMAEYCLGPLFGSKPMIEGYVEHKKYPFGLMREAAYWLFLFYRPGVYFRLLGKTCHRRAWYPLGLLLRFTFWARHDVVDWFTKITQYMARPFQKVDDDLPF